jgi:MoaA/NifB/PqqE/SkfB family radical SAM enzyme
VELAGLRKVLHQVDKIRYRPALLAKIARGYFRTLVLRRPTLRTIEFSITNACQARCGYCYANRFSRPGDDVLSLDEIRSTWEQASRLGAFSSVLLGGEPILHPQFLEIVEALEPRKNIVTFATNGIDLGDELVLELAKRGVFNIVISLNSLDAEVNDELRGYRGHLGKALEAIERCQRHGLTVFLGVATGKPFLGETIRLAEFAREKGLGVMINLMSPMGRAEGQEELLFDAEFWTEYRKLVDSSPHIRSDFDWNLDLRIGCPAGFEKVHVAPYGDVTGCAIQAVSFGNVRRESLASIVDRMRSFHHYSKRSPSCIAAVDSEYIRDYTEYASQYATLPYPVDENPCYEKDKARRGPALADR